MVGHWHQKHTKSRLFDTKKTQNSWFLQQNSLIHILWLQPENFDTSTAGGASDKYQVWARCKYVSSYFWIEQFCRMRQVDFAEVVKMTQDKDDDQTIVRGANIEANLQLKRS